LKLGWVVTTKRAKVKKEKTERKRKKAGAIIV